VRLVGFFQNHSEGMPYYAEEVRKLYERNGWLRKESIDVFLHDAKVKKWGSDKSRIEQLIEKGFRPRPAPNVLLDDGINAARATLPMCEFDQEACSEGIKVLKAYRKEWDEDLGKFKDTPRHDWASHGADAFRYMALAHRDLATPPPPPKPKRVEIRRPTMNEFLAEHDRMNRLRGNRI
jgi:phage terminase large subunit